MKARAYTMHPKRWPNGDPIAFEEMRMNTLMFHAEGAAVTVPFGTSMDEISRIMSNAYRRGLVITVIEETPKLLPQFCSIQ